MFQLSSFLHVQTRKFTIIIFYFHQIKIWCDSKLIRTKIWFLYRSITYLPVYPALVLGLGITLYFDLLLKSDRSGPDSRVALIYPSLDWSPYTFSDASVVSFMLLSTACVWQGNVSHIQIWNITGPFPRSLP
jgi:hypothetical protein